MHCALEICWENWKKNLEIKTNPTWVGSSLYYPPGQIRRPISNIRISTNSNHIHSWEDFFPVISDRLQVFMIQNCYITRDIQKGFVFGVPGCLEHTFTLMEALKEAKEHQRQIVISWLDLANAYGSVRHNLIQFALNWYYVPLIIQELIFDYYEKLCAMVITKGWSTVFSYWI